MRQNGIDQLIPATAIRPVMAAVIQLYDQGHVALPVDHDEIHGLLRHPAQGCPAQGWIALDDLERIGQAHLGAHVVAPRQVSLDFCQRFGFPC